MKLLPFEYGVRNLGRSRLRLTLGVGGNVLVVLLVIASGAFVTGMRRALLVTGSERNVILLGAGSEESIERSQIEMRSATVAGASLAGVQSRLGVPYVSPEIHMQLAIGLTADQEDKALVVFRGVTAGAFLVHPQVRVIEGRPPEGGRDEVMIGGLVASKFGAASLGVGATLWIDNRPWTISGRFEAPRTVMDGEVWMPLSDLQVVGQRDTLSCVVLTLDDSGKTEFEDVEAFAAQRLDLELVAMKETEYYRKLSEFFGPIRSMIIASSTLIALGGVLGGFNTMYAAFASRVREIGSLQVMGYSRAAVAISMVQESLLVAAAGGLIACALGLLLLDGIAIQFSMGAFGLIVDAGVIGAGLGATLVLGCFGAVAPVIRCLRLPISEALKA